MTFPALSKLQSEAENLRRGFLATLSLVALIVVPLAGAIAYFIPDLVRHVIGDQWSGAVGPVRLLAAAGLLRALSASWGPLYQAQGRTEKPFWKNAVRAVLTLAPAYPLTMRYGIEGMSACVLLGISGALAFDLFRAGAGEAVRIRLREVGGAVAGPVVAAVVTLILVVGLRGVLGTGLLAFLALGASFVLLYAGAILLLEAAGRETGLGKLLSLIGRAE